MESAEVESACWPPGAAGLDAEVVRRYLLTQLGSDQRHLLVVGDYRSFVDKPREQAEGAEPL